MSADGDIYTTLKVLIMGDSGTGKSSLMIRFTDDLFDRNTTATIGVDYKSKDVDIDGKRVRLSIWDTAGAERYRTMTSAFYRNGQGVIFVYDVSVRSSFTRLDSWIDEMQTHATRPNYVSMLVANKIDLVNREVSTEEGRAFARKHRMLFIEASAKTKEGVQQAFNELVHKVLETPGLWDRHNSRHKDTITANNTDPDTVNVTTCWGTVWNTLTGWFRAA